MWEESRWSIHDSAKVQALIHTSVGPIVHFIIMAAIQDYETVELLGKG